MRSSRVSITPGVTIIFIPTTTSSSPLPRVTPTTASVSFLRGSFQAPPAFMNCLNVPSVPIPCTLLFIRFSIASGSIYVCILRHFSLAWLLYIWHSCASWEMRWKQGITVDNWVYEEANTTFIQDEEMLNRLMNMNPNSLRKLVQTFLEANGREYWETSEQSIERLRQLYSEVEDKIEGIDR
ncbi:hypothetical protein MLD38_037427 [Melastoma candidum]|uniref:Uncharacterized protein n=1 Tax=Melastoma candidum TaxID=119954 RepID=A0ACB9LNQ6_9MYRT|nr:hypothetical protein MLD38_037427 [Melastoma candidum]